MKLLSHRPFSSSSFGRGERCMVIILSSYFLLTLSRSEVQQGHPQLQHFTPPSTVQFLGVFTRSSVRRLTYASYISSFNCDGKFVVVYGLIDQIFWFCRIAECRVRGGVPRRGRHKCPQRSDQPSLQSQLGWGNWCRRRRRDALRSYGGPCDFDVPAAQCCHVVCKSTLHADNDETYNPGWVSLRLCSPCPGGKWCHHCTYIFICVHHDNDKLCHSFKHILHADVLRAEIFGNSDGRCDHVWNVYDAARPLHPHHSSHQARSSIWLEKGGRDKLWRRSTRICTYINV